MVDRTLKNFSRIGVFVLVLISGISLAGWFLGIPQLASIVPGWPRIAIIVILCFLLCAAAVLELTVRESGKTLERVRMAAAGLVLFVAAYELADYLIAGDTTPTSGIGYLLGLGLGRPSAATAFNLLAAAAALMLPRNNRWGRIYSGLIAVGLAVTAFDFAGYAYGIAALSRGPTLSAMSLPTMTSFFLLFFSMLLARPRAGWTAVLFAPNSGGITARRFFPILLVLPFIMNGIVLVIYRSRPFGAPFGFAILAVLTSIGLGIITLVFAGWLARHEGERRRSQGLLEAIAEGSPATIYVKDLAGRYLMVNQRYLDIFRVDRQAVIGRTDYDIFSKHEADAFRAMDQRVVGADHPLVGEEMASQADGLHTYVSVKAPLRDETGGTYAIFGISTDITERKRSERALASSEERTRLIVETALDAVISIDRDGVITGWNSQAEKIFGWTRAEALGRPIDQTIVPKVQRDAHKRGLARYLRTGESHFFNRRIELIALHRNGHEFPVELAVAPIQSGAMGFTAFVRDITERKNAQTRLQAQVERLALLERITHAVGQRQDMPSVFQVVVRTLEDRLPADFVCACSYDAMTNLLTVNHVGVNSASLGRELGIVENAEIPVDKNGLSRCLEGALVHEPDIAGVDFPFPRRLAGHGLRSLIFAPLAIESDIFGLLVVARRKENAFSSADCEFLRQLGEHVGLAARQAQLRGSLEVAYDDLKKTQQAILQQERLRALGQMASGIAHDINNAISPVAVYTQSLLEREKDITPQTRNYLETVGRVVKDVSATIGRMRDFYRRDESAAELQVINLNDLVPQVLELTRARWSDMPQQRGVVIRTVIRLEEDLPLVMADAAEIREAVTNLIFNAVDAMPEGGTIAIRTSSHPSESGLRRVCFEVEDSGVGMDETTRRRCLEPFFTTKGERGTGLGLAMVYGAAQRHKAALDIESKPGKGTSVRLEFAAADIGLKGRPAVKLSDIRPLRVLLVDDDPAVLHSTQHVLELDGHTVVAADGGKQGIDALRAANKANLPFEVMITDLGMPYVDGNQVARAAKELSPSTTVVLLTGWGRKIVDGAGQNPSIDYALSKPLDLDELRSVFARRLE